MPDNNYKPCPACLERRRHTRGELNLYHPEAGGGYVKESGWSRNITPTPQKDNDAL